MTPATSTLASREDFDRLTSKVQDQGSALQSMQVDIRHIAGSVDRAFLQMREDKGAMTSAMHEFVESVRQDRLEAKATRDAILEFRSALRTVKWIAGAIVALLVTIASMYTAGNEKDKARTDQDVAALRADMDRRKLSVDLKIDTMSQQVQEVRLEQQRREAEHP